jgi:hypothetical protein
MYTFLINNTGGPALVPKDADVFKFQAALINIYRNHNVPSTGPGDASRMVASSRHLNPVKQLLPNLGVSVTVRGAGRENFGQ